MEFYQRDEILNNVYNTEENIKSIDELDKEVEAILRKEKEPYEQIKIMSKYDQSLLDDIVKQREEEFRLEVEKDRQDLYRQFQELYPDARNINLKDLQKIGLGEYLYNLGEVYQGVNPLIVAEPFLVDSKMANLRGAWTEFYNKKQKERLKKSSDIAKMVELHLGGVSPIADDINIITNIYKKIEYPFNVGVNKALKAFTFNFMPEEKDPLYDNEYLNTVFSGSAAVGEVVGTLLRDSLLFATAGSLGLPSKLSTQLAKIKGGKTILKGLGLPKEIIKRTFKRTNLLSKAISRLPSSNLKNFIHISPSISEIYSPLITKTGQVISYGISGGIALNELMLGGIAGELSLMGEQLHSKEKKHGKNLAKAIISSGLFGATSRYAMGLINDPAGWWGRILGDGVYSLGSQGVDILLGNREDFNLDYFFKNFVYGHLMGELQGFLLGGARKTYKQRVEEFQLTEANKIYELVNKETKAIFGDAANTSRVAIDTAITDAVMTSIKKTNSTYNTKLSYNSPEVKTLVNKLVNKITADQFIVMSAAVGEEPHIIDINKIKRQRATRQKKVIIKNFTPKKPKNFNVSRETFENEVIFKKFLPEESFYKYIDERNDVLSQIKIQEEPVESKFKFYKTAYNEKNIKLFNEWFNAKGADIKERNKEIEKLYGILTAKAYKAFGNYTDIMPEEIPSMIFDKALSTGLMNKDIPNKEEIPKILVSYFDRFLKYSIRTEQAKKLARSEIIDDKDTIEKYGDYKKDSLSTFFENEESLQEFYGAMLEIALNGNKKDLPKMISVYLALVHDYKTKEIAELFNKIEFDGKTNWSRQNIQHYLENGIGLIKSEISNLKREYVYKLKEYKKNKIEQKEILKKQAIKDVKDINVLTGYKTKISALNRITIKNKNSFVLNIDSAFKEIELVYGRDVAEVFLYKTADVLNNVLKKMKLNKHIEIVQPKTKNNTTLLLISKTDKIKFDKNEIISNIWENFTSDFKKSDFVIYFKSNENINKAITKFTNPTFVEINDYNKKTIQYNIDRISDLKNFVRFIDPDSYAILNSTIFNVERMSKYLDEIYSITDISKLQNKTDIINYIEGKSDKEISKLLDIITKITQDKTTGEIIDDLDSYFTTTDIGGDEVTLYDDIDLPHDLDDEMITALYKSSVNDTKADIEEGNAGFFKNIWSRAGNFGKSFRQWQKDMFTDFADKERYDIRTRRLMQTIYHIQGSLEYKGIVKARNLVKVIAREGGFDKLSIPNRKRVDGWLLQILEKERQDLLSLRDPNTLLTEKLPNIKQEKKYLPLFQSFIENTEASKFSHYSAMLMREIHNKDDLLLSKILCQKFGVDPEILQNYVRTIYNKHYKVLEELGKEGNLGLNNDLFEELADTLKVKVSTLLEENGIKNLINLDRVSDRRDKDFTSWLDTVKSGLNAVNQDRLDFYIDNYFEIKNNKLSYVHRTILSNPKNANSFKTSFIAEVIEGKTPTGVKFGRNDFNEFTKRKISSIDVALKNGYVVAEGGLLNIASEHAYMWHKIVLKRYADKLKLQFLRDFKASGENWLEFLKDVNGVFYFPTEKEFNQLKALQKRYKNEIQIAEANNNTERIILLGKQINDISEMLKLMKYEKKVLTHIDKNKGIDNRILARDALFGNDINLKFLPMNVGSYSSDIAGIEYINYDKTGKKFVKNAGGRRDKWKFIADGISTEYSYWKAGSLPGWDGLYMEGNVWKAFKNYVLKDDFLILDTKYDFLNSLIRGYRKLNRILKVIRFYKPNIILVNDLQQMALANPKSFVNIKWGIENVLKEIQGVPVDPIYNGAKWNNVFNDGVGLEPILNGIQKEVFTALGDDTMFKQFKKLLSISNKKDIIKSFYTIARSWQNSTWVIDRILRSALYKTEFERLKNSFNNIKDAELRAAEYTNNFMVKYSRVPMKTRQAMNMIGFVFTYKTQTFRMYNTMFQMFYKGVKTLFGADIKENYIYTPISKTRIGKSMELMAPLLRKIVYTATAKILPLIISGYSFNGVMDWLIGYRAKKDQNKNDLLNNYISYLSMSGPLFELEKWVTRGFRAPYVLLKYNIAALPGLFISLISNQDLITGEKIIETGGKTFAEYFATNPHKAFAQIGISLFNSYVPFMPDIRMLRKDDIDTIKKILNVFAIGYYYNTKSPLSLIESFRKAYEDPNLSLQEKIILQKKFSREMDRLSKRLMSDAYMKALENFRRSV